MQWNDSNRNKHKQNSGDSRKPASEQLPSTSDVLPRNRRTGHCQGREKTCHWSGNEKPQNVYCCKSFRRRDNFRGLTFIFKWANPGLFLIYYQSFSNKQYNFYNKSLWKNVHPVYGAGIRTHDLSNMRHLLNGPIQLFCFMNLLSVIDWFVGWFVLRSVAKWRTNYISNWHSSSWFISWFQKAKSWG